MNLQQLKAICEIARRHFNVSAAAKALHRSQPALSRQIAEIESELGIRIFSRTRNKVVGLTPQGIEVLTISQRMIRDSDGRSIADIRSHKQWLAALPKPGFTLRFTS